MDIREEILYGIFLDIHKSYYALDSGRHLDTRSGTPVPTPHIYVLVPPDDGRK